MKMQTKRIVRGFSALGVALVALSACQGGRKQFEVSGDMVNLPDTILVIQEGDQIDTLLTSGGKFTFSMPADSVSHIYIYSPQGVRIQLPAVPGEKAVLSGDAQGDYSVSGTQFYAGLQKLNAAMEGSTQENIVEKVMTFLAENPDNAAAVELLPVIGSLAPDSLEVALGLLSDKVKNGPMKSFLENSLRDIRAQIEADREAEALQAPGREVPDFTLKDINGKDLTLSSLRGKYVVLDFWGSWCIWCIRGVPKMKEYYEKYAGKFEILGIDCSDTEEDWKAAVKEHGMPWLHVYNPKDSELLSQYGIQGFPTKIILDGEGKIVKTVVGESPDFYDKLDELFGK
ncbi:MAG: redoxin domain-containing protein [Bacteroidaceae bacterium]|nr:redoxin domain-containing protein [Bacteroidaceae bacterium]